MNPVVKAQVKDFYTTNSLGDRLETENFEIYSIFSVLNGGLGESVDPLEAHLNGDEFGIDGIAIMVQGKLVTDTDSAMEAIDGLSNRQRVPDKQYYF